MIHWPTTCKQQLVLVFFLLVRVNATFSPTNSPSFSPTGGEYIIQQASSRLLTGALHQSRSGNYYSTTGVFGSSCYLRNTTENFANSLSYGSSVCNSTGTTTQNVSFNLPFGIWVSTSEDIFVVEQTSIIRRISGNNVDVYAGILNIFSTDATAANGDGGPATAATFSGMFVGITGDSNGNIYAADAGNQRIRKIDSIGIISTYAGTGEDAISTGSGPATSTPLDYPITVWLNSNGVLYVAEHSRLKMVGADGIMTDLDVGVASCFAIAGDTNGNVYFASAEAHRIYKLSSTGAFAAVAGNGTLNNRTVADGTYSTTTGIGRVYGMVVNSDGVLLYNDDTQGATYYLIDADNTFPPTLAPTQLPTEAPFQPTIVPTRTPTPEPTRFPTITSSWVMNSAKFVNMAVFGTTDSAGSIYITQEAYCLISVFDSAMNLVASYGTASQCTTAGTTTATATYNVPHTIFVDTLGVIYVAEYSSFVVRKIDGSDVSIFAGQVGVEASSGLDSNGDGGPATAATFTHRLKVTGDSVGNIFIADATLCKIRKVDSAGIVTTFAGTGVSSTDGLGPAAITSINAYSAWVSSLGEVYFCSGSNIKKVDSSNTVVNVGGSGIGISDITGDSLGNIYIADWTRYFLHILSPNGDLNKIAGTGVKSASTLAADGTSSAIATVTSVFAAINGNIMFVDQTNDVVYTMTSKVTLTPTVRPTAVPSLAPSGFPSTAPSFSLTEGPTAPTYTPSAAPSAVPTALTNPAPTFAPSAAPVVPPPSTHPSSSPTRLPTEVPSVAPDISIKFLATLGMEGIELTTSDLSDLDLEAVALAAADVMGVDSDTTTVAEHELTAEGSRRRRQLRAAHLLVSYSASIELSIDIDLTAQYADDPSARHRALKEMLSDRTTFAEAIAEHAVALGATQIQTGTLSSVQVGNVTVHSAALDDDNTAGSSSGGGGGDDSSATIIGASVGAAVGGCAVIALAVWYAYIYRPFDDKSTQKVHPAGQQATSAPVSAKASDEVNSFHSSHASIVAAHAKKPPVAAPVLFELSGPVRSGLTSDHVTYIVDGQYRETAGGHSKSAKVKLNTSREALKREYDTLLKVHLNAPGHFVIPYAFLEPESIGYVPADSSHAAYCGLAMQPGQRNDLNAVISQDLESDLQDNFNTATKVIKVVRALHQEAGLAWLDVKPSNFVYVDGNKLVGIDLATAIDAERMVPATYAEATFCYAPPEIATQSGTCTAEQYDIWSLGITIMEVLDGGRSLFSGCAGDVGAIKQKAARLTEQSIKQYIYERFGGNAPYKSTIRLLLFGALNLSASARISCDQMLSIIVSLKSTSKTATGRGSGSGADDKLERLLDMVQRMDRRVEKGMALIEEAVEEVGDKVDAVNSNIQSLREEVRVSLRAMHNMLRGLMEGHSRVPTLMLIVPNEPKSVLERVSALATDKLTLYFICPVTLKKGSAYSLNASREWVKKAKPVLKVSLVVLKVALLTMGMPFPIPNIPLNRETDFLDSLFTGVEADALNTSAVSLPTYSNKLQSMKHGGEMYTKCAGRNDVDILQEELDEQARNSAESYNDIYKLLQKLEGVHNPPEGWMPAKTGLTRVISRQGNTAWVHPEAVERYRAEGNACLALSSAK